MVLLRYEPMESLTLTLTKTDYKYFLRISKGKMTWSYNIIIIKEKRLFDKHLTEMAGIKK